MILSTQVVKEVATFKMSMLFQFYSKNKGSIATTLLKPKRKQGLKSAEVELSKSKSEIRAFDRHVG